MNSLARINDREHIEQLEEQIRWLRGELGILVTAEQIAEAQQVFQLTTTEARLLLHLINAKLATADTAMLAMYSHNYDDWPEPKIVDIFICKLRAKLKRYGIRFETHWGTGYSLPAASRRRIAEVLGQQPFTIPAQP